jgi:hypothetical protein
VPENLRGKKEKAAGHELAVFILLPQPDSYYEILENYYLLGCFEFCKRT